MKQVKRYIARNTVLQDVSDCFPTQENRDLVKMTQTLVQTKKVSITRENTDALD